MYDQIKKEKNSKQMYDQIKKDKTLGEKKSPIFLNFVFKKILNKKIIILNTKCKSYFFWVSLLTMCIMTKLDGIIFRMWKNCKKSSFSHKNLISKNLDAWYFQLWILLDQDQSFKLSDFKSIGSIFLTKIQIFF